jgi:hypothetical protein
LFSALKIPYSPRGCDGLSHQSGLIHWGLGEGGDAYSHPAQIYAKSGTLQTAFQLILVQMAHLSESGTKIYSAWDGSTFARETQKLRDIDILLQDNEPEIEEDILDLLDYGEEGKHKFTSLLEAPTQLPL